MKGRIAEIFESVQGEGLYFGERQIFVRFFGCNLACRFCDTRLDRYSEYEPQEVLKELKIHGRKPHSVSFTGGEPLLQKDFLKEILKLSKQHGYKNYLETNGTLAGELKDVIDDVDIVSMDLKLPSSTGMKGLWGLHRRFLQVASAKDVFLKVVVCLSTMTGDFREALALVKGLNKAPVLVLQPNSYDEPRLLEEKLESFRYLCGKEEVTCCVIPQMHKKIGMK
jgi:organic radical activating enzyme